MKRTLTLILVLAILVLPVHVRAQSCEDDLDTCLELLDESATGLIECQAGNEGEISVGDIFDLIPAYRRLPRRTKFAITAALTTLISVGVLFIPPPDGS